MPPHRGQASDWWDFAQGDLRGARALAGARDVPPRLACALSHQAVEKAFKCALVFAEVDFPKTHDLDALRDMLPADCAVRVRFPSLAWLTDWYIDSRYPENLHDANDDESGAAVSESSIILDAIAEDLRARGATFLG